MLDGIFKKNHYIYITYIALQLYNYLNYKLNIHYFCRYS